MYRTVEDDTLYFNIHNIHIKKYIQKKKYLETKYKKRENKDSKFKQPINCPITY